MKISQVTALAAVISMAAAFAATANEAKFESSTRGRSGFVLVPKAEPARTTIALSREGQGIGRDMPAKAEKQRHQWKNPSRGPSAAVVTHR
jgi:hypothetical protein